jgi:branched-chain amino acid transport system substrate-binding protein
MLDAWAKWTNAHGGINGHPVKMIVLDDGLVPARSQAAIRRLVDGEKVVAIVGSYSLADVTWADYVQKKGVPVVGGTATEAPFMTHPGFYASGAQTPALLYALVNETRKAGKLKLGVLVCAEAPVCAGLPPVMERIATQVIGGSSVVYTNRIAASQPNYTAVCIAAKAEGVDALYIAQNSIVVERVTEQCAQQGFRPVILGTVGTLDRNAKNPNFEGALSALPNASIAIDSTPAGKAFHEALQTYASSLVGTPQYNNALTSAWAGGELFAAAARKANVGPDSTPADVKRGLYLLRRERLGGMSAALRYTPGKPTFVQCYFVQRVSGGNLTSLYGTAPVCIPQAKVRMLMSALQG